MTPAEMIDVAETELLSNRHEAASASSLPQGENASVSAQQSAPMLRELDDWLARLASFSPEALADGSPSSMQVQDALLPADFALASYRASLLPLLGDQSEAKLQGATAALARLPLAFHPQDQMQKLKDPHIAAMSLATLSLELPQLDDALQRTPATGSTIESTTESTTESTIEPQAAQHE
jgi:hypothetical protein